MSDLVLDATLQAHAELKNAIKSGDAVDAQTLRRWKHTIADANRMVAHLARLVDSTEARRQVEVDLLNEELRRELVDREANAARTSDRFRVMAERGSSTSHSTYERASASAAAIERSIAAGCLHAAALRSLSAELI